MQFLDRAWGGVQRSAGDDTAKKAIGALRSALNDAPVSDTLGQESMAAYKAARELARQRFSLIDANPAYKAVVNGVEPDKFFQKYVAGANVSEIAGLKNLIGPDNVAMLQNTLVGNLKHKALNGASDEAGEFSQAAFNKALQDPVQMPRLAELFKDAPETLDQLYRVGRVAESVIKEPKGAFTNKSNTAAGAANIIRDLANSNTGKSLISSALSKITPAPLRVLSDAVKEQTALNAGRAAVDEAINAGVTAAPLKASAPVPKVGKLSELLTRASGGMAASSASNREKKRE